MDAKEIVRCIDGQIGMLQREARISRFAGGANLVLEWMIPARDYILAAKSQIADKDAALYAYESEILAAGFGTIAEMAAQLADRDAQLQAANTRASDLFDELGIVQNEAATRIGELERQIGETERMLREEWWLNHRCPISTLYGDDGEMQCNATCCRKDFKRDPIGELSAHVVQRRLATATADMTLLEEARAKIAEMRKRCSDISVPIRRVRIGSVTTTTSSLTVTARRRSNASRRASARSPLLISVLTIR